VITPPDLGGGEGTVDHLSVGARFRRVERQRDRRAFVVIGGLALGSHVLMWALGISLAGTVLGPGELGLDFQSWHLLPLDLLQHHFLQSITHLNSQPPLFNTATAVLYRLPQHLFLARLALLLFATLLPIAALGLLRELGINRVVSTVVIIVFIILDPAQLLYPSWYFYGLPTATLLTCAGWAGARWTRTRSPLPGVTFGWLMAVVILTNSAFQVYGFVIATVPIVYLQRRQWRIVLAAMLPPLLVVGAWYVNDVAQFGTYTTSSWDGMNMARITTGQDSQSDLRLLVKERALTPLALQRPFYPLGAYGALGNAKPTGIPALDLKQKLVTPNLNNIAYIRISNEFLKNDLHWIGHRPLLYAKHVTEGVRIWLLPSEQTPGVELPAYSLHGWTAFYDHLVMLQLQPDPGADRAAVFSNVAPGNASISLTLVIESVLSLVLLPIVGWRRRRRYPAQAAAVAWIWIVMVVLTVATSLVEVGENNRFRFELGALPIVASVIAVTWLIEDMRFHSHSVVAEKRV
jgi:hypothetical protein